MKYIKTVASVFYPLSLPSRERGLKLIGSGLSAPVVLSLPSRERGLKLLLFTFILSNLYVAPLAGARIEIGDPEYIKIMRLSLPSRERGLKFHPVCVMQERAEVAPLAGARIEMSYAACGSSTLPVAPLAGARIEIVTYINLLCCFWSLPSRERGLKFLSMMPSLW